MKVFLFLLMALTTLSTATSAQDIKGKYAVLLECNKAENWCRPISRPDTGTEAQFSKSAHKECTDRAPGIDCTLVAINMTGCFYIGFIRAGVLPYLPLDRRTPEGFGTTLTEVKEDCPGCVTFYNFGCEGTPRT